jgi:hypothetical protein
VEGKECGGGKKVREREGGRLREGERGTGGRERHVMEKEKERGRDEMKRWRREETERGIEREEERR